MAVMPANCSDCLIDRATVVDLVKIKAPSMKSYLGDSVYVDMEIGMIKLTTENGDDGGPSNTIYLEPFVYRALVEWFDRIERLSAAAGSTPPPEVAQ